MQASPGRDFAVGLFVLAGLAAIAYLSIQLGGLSYKGPGGLLLTGSFDEIGGLSVRAPVTIAGVKVGQVTGIDLDDDLRARVQIDVDASIPLPIDTAAGIRTQGLLGDQFIALEPGAEDATLESGDVLSFTESAINLDKLIGAVVHGGIGDGE
ncbi:MAG: outer membrane lipid asymmetry maintenance protein MlaD [Myxococcota bacterium]|nr:outer membrane lipid asymmetry maintenance protein MlaD [Myxococcales bacterium]